MKFITNLILASIVTVSLATAQNIPLPEVPIIWYQSVVTSTNKSQFIKQNLPVFIAKYPTWAKQITKISITNDIANKGDYIKIYNNIYTNAVNDPLYIVTSTNKIKQSPRANPITPIVIHSYGGADPHRP